MSHPDIHKHGFIFQATALELLDVCVASEEEFEHLRIEIFTRDFNPILFRLRTTIAKACAELGQVGGEDG